LSEGAKDVIDIGVKAVKVVLVVALQPKLSVTTKVYIPATRFVKFAVVLVPVKALLVHA
jgi:hypothetical protein